MGKPAATIGHMHVCPKTTGTVPHVGGPVVIGSTNVARLKLTVSLQLEWAMTAPTAVKLLLATLQY